MPHGVAEKINKPKKNKVNHEVWLSFIFDTLDYSNYFLRD